MGGGGGGGGGVPGCPCNNYILSMLHQSVLHVARDQKLDTGVTWE